MEETLQHSYLPEILVLMRNHPSDANFAEKLSDYHESDIADALAALTPQERKIVYPALTTEYLSDIFAYMDDAHEYLRELSHEQAAKIIAHMDSDDAVYVLEEMDEARQQQIIAMMDKDASEDVQLIMSYEDDEIGSKMTTNYIATTKGLTVRQAMHELVEQAGENDNISIIYVTNADETFYGSIEFCKNGGKTGK